MIKPAHTGIYEVCVKTKDSNGKITKEYLSFESANDLTVNAKLSASKLSLGADVTVTASAKGGNSGYTYSVYWKKSLLPNGCQL